MDNGGIMNNMNGKDNENADNGVNGVSGAAGGDKQNTGAGAGAAKNIHAHRIYAKDEVLLVQEAMNLLEAKKFSEADEVCDLALKVNPNYAAAYIGKLMADLRVRREGELKELNRPYDKNENFRKALECANETMAAQLRADLNQVRNHRRQIIFILILVLLVLFGTGMYLVTRVIIPEKERYESYNRAKALIDGGKVDEAGWILKDLGDYMDADKIYASDPRMRYAAGKTVEFGKFEQDNNAENGKEAIEWVILKNDGEKLLLFTDKGLAYRYFHPSTPGQSWENSYVREWLNGEFFDAAFDEKQKGYIVPVTIDNGRSQIVSGAPEDYDDAAPTVDRVFLLSQKEEADYLARLEDYVDCVLSESALRECSEAFNIEMDEMLKMLKDGRLEKMGMLDVPWWLRTVNNDHSEADVMSYYGKLTNKIYALPETVLTVAVRPVMWVSLDAFRDQSE